MDDERAIIGASIVIAGIGALDYFLSDSPDGKSLGMRLGGAVGVAVLLSALAATGTGPAKLARGLAVLTAVTVFFLDAPTIFGFVDRIGKTAEKGAGKPAPDYRNIPPNEPRR